MADQLFTQPREVPVIVCKKCQHAVRPKEVIRHLQSTHHRLTRPTARQVFDAIQQWDGVQACDQWTVPARVSEPIPGLPRHTDGILCTRDPACGFVARSSATIRTHWRVEHRWSALQGHGNSRYEDRTAAEQDFQRATTTVSCQRAFTHGVGSHYIHVERPGPDSIMDIEAPDAPDAHAVNQLVAQLVAQLEEAFTEQQAHRTVIEAGERDEANPWLRRTQWAVYLAGLDPQRLVECMQRPSEPTTDDEHAAAAIWDSMEAVARVSQRVSSQAGHMIRIEAVRTERDQTPHTPLQAYMDEDNIVRHAIPWQQVLMFFVRTQIEHDWESPHYRFTERQRRAWQALWRLAQADGSRSNSVRRSQSMPVINGANAPQPTSEATGRPTSEAPGERTGERLGERTGERIGERIGERTGDQAGEWTGDRIGERTGGPTSEAPDQRTGERTGE